MGSMPPDPPRLMGLTVPCSQSRLFSFNQLPTLNFIETPGLDFRDGSLSLAHFRIHLEEACDVISHVTTRKIP